MSVPFDFANRSLTLALAPPDEDDEELMSTISFSKSRIDKFGASSLCPGAPDVVALDVDV